ncbi:hypothetical protein RD792_013026 [Penstemon davidsonii]|uniref:Pectinesterase inhibitor domain-containing protein n=1 Tax=Penstemon davidsonii TaxID=160366 RepID=A0ABR0CSV0_9LAMI|nr:hypothetical protein RD792_013026 [Penstemon davidsonii]
MVQKTTDMLLYSESDWWIFSRLKSDEFDFDQQSVHQTSGFDQQSGSDQKLLQRVVRFFSFFLSDCFWILVLSLWIQRSCFNPIGMDTTRGTTHGVLLRTKSPADLKEDRRKTTTVPVVSAALTDEDTCADGFAGKAMNGGVKTAVRQRILNIVHITSNALALVNSYAALNG